jgi:glycosyltransferase involved in cell wall biosynthesis
MLKVLMDTSPIYNSHSGRGIGMYTKLLVDELKQHSDVQLIEKNSLEKPDVVHYPYFDLFFSSLPLFRSQKTVFTIHDVIPLKFPDHYKPGKKGQFFFYKQKFAAQSAQAIITDSEASKADIIEHLKIKPEKVHVVYLAANPDLQKASENEQKKVQHKYRLPAHYILYVGDINYNKNLPQLMKSLKFLPDEVELVCVGRNFRPQGIPEWQAIEEQIALSDVSSRVHLLNNLGSDAISELSAIYSSAEAYVQPSLYEGFGLPILEAMQCHAPVVCSRNSSLIEVGSDQVVYTEPTAESLAEGVKQVLSWSKKNRGEKIKSAYNWSQKFSWQQTATQTVQIYREVTGK